MDEKRKIKNAMEDAVEVVLQRTLREHPEYFKCKCEVCLNDIRAKSLNKIRPKYYSTVQGEAFTQMASFTVQIQTDIQVELNTAIAIIGDNPSHK